MQEIFNFNSEKGNIFRHYFFCYIDLQKDLLIFTIVGSKKYKYITKI